MFRGQSTNPDSSPRDGIYTDLFGGITAVAETGDLIPDGNGDPFSSDNAVFGFSSPTISGSNIVFEGDSPGAAHRGIYATFGGGALEKVIDTRHGSNGGFTTLASPAIDGDNIAFWGFSVFTFPLSTSFEGIYRHTGGSGGSSATIADEGDTVLGKTPVRIMQTFSSAQVDIDGTDTVFMARDSFDLWGLYRTFGTLAVGAPRIYAGTGIPGGGDTFDLFFTSSVSADAGATAFEGQNTSGSVQGVYGIDGFSATTVADLTTPVPNEAGTFTSFSEVSIEGITGDVVFLAQDVSGNPGLYAAHSGIIGLLVEVGDLLDGRTVSGLSFGHEGLDGTTAVFAATFTDGAEGIFTTDITTALIPEPASAMWLAVPALGRVIRRRR